jgi:NADH:ubiquinone oxidoreductase subunit E
MIKEITKNRIENTFKKIEENPSLMSIPVSILEQFKQTQYLNEKHIKQWEEILNLPISEIKKLMLSETEQGEVLRSTSIFVRIP